VRKGQVGGGNMGNITLLSVNAAYGLAVLLFVLMLVWRRSSELARMPGAPPEIPVGKVQVWPYRNMDLIALAAIVAVFYLLAISNSMAVDAEDGPVITAGGVVFSIGFQIFTAVVLTRVNPVKWLGLAWRRWPLVFAIAPVTVLSMWALFAGLQLAGYMDLMDRLGVEKVQETVTIFQKEKDVMVVLLLAFAAAIVAPVCEEVVFRGYLYPVAKKFAGPWMAGLCSALVFSAAHGSLTALLPLFVFGLVLVALYEFTGSIWAPMAVHFLFNGATVVVQLLPRLSELPQTVGQ
jgi:membrane protease YdiL (CAAX protease family)